MFGQWMTKAAAALFIVPELLNQLGHAINQHDMLTEPIAGTIKAIATALGFLGIRRAIK